MHEILFRGKRIDNGQWEYGNYNNVNGKAYIFPEDAPDSYDNYQVDTATVGQYTGMTDKNGNKVFEGDIVRRKETPFDIVDIGVVVYDEAIGCFRMNAEKNGVTKRYDFVPSDVYRDGYCTVDCKATFEVMGNIFDNKDLLKGGMSDGC